MLHWYCVNPRSKTAVDKEERAGGLRCESGTDTRRQLACSIGMRSFLQSGSSVWEGVSMPRIHRIAHVYHNAQLTCSASVAQHGYRAVAKLQLHAFVKTGTGSVWGLRVEVLLSRPVPSPSSSSSGSLVGTAVTGMLSDVESAIVVVDAGKMSVRGAAGVDRSSISWG